jgi:hypothetical protein
MTTAHGAMPLLRIILPLLLLLPCGPLAAQEPKPDFSAAERLLFVNHQLGNVKAPATLRYRFSKQGTLEPGYEDQVALSLKTGADGRCCAAHTDFLSAGRRLELPDLPAAEGNPVILHFLEREVREMQRLTRGSQTHFRKRIRMALFNAATVQPLTLRFRGREITGQEVRITPFVDDPNRPRYEMLARKEYRFMLSDAVPGSLVAIRTRVAAADGSAAPLLAEELTLEGAEAPDKSTR